MASQQTTMQPLAAITCEHFANKRFFLLNIVEISKEPIAAATICANNEPLRDAMAHLMTVIVFVAAFTAAQALCRCAPSRV